jgi:hypothetical protein
MVNRNKIYGICDVCGFRYNLSELVKNSFGLMVCPTDNDGRYDLKNHPQNKTKGGVDSENVKFHRRSPMPPTNVTVTDWLPN